MTVLVAWVIAIDEPLLQLLVASDLHWRQLTDCLGEALTIVGIHTQHLGCMEGIAQCIKHNLVVHGASGSDGGVLAHRSLLGAYRRHDDEPSILRMRLHVVEIEVGCSLDYWVPFSQKFLIAGIEVMLPQVSGEPCAAVREHTPCSSIDRSCHSPQVGVVMCHPSTAVVHLLGSDGTRLAQVANHIEERAVGLLQVAHLGRPVVHLGIDVDGVFRIPWCVALIVPHTLQVGRLTAWLR